MTQSFRYIGHPVRRTEDDRLLRGRGRFTDDFCAPGQAYAALVRSPYPHARIAGINISDAEQAPGVLGVFTAADLTAAGLAAIDHRPLPSTRDDLKLQPVGDSGLVAGPHTLLPHDKARHLGEAVAMVVATTPAQALDAAEQVDVDWDVLAPVLLAADCGASPVWDECPDNLCIDGWHGQRDATEEAINNAAHVFTLSTHVQRVTGVPLEPRAALGVYDKATQHYTLHAGSGGAVRQRGELAAVLGIDKEQLRVLSLDVGGNFGTRNRVYVEFGLVLFAARKLGVPVKYTATRSESFLSDYQGRDLQTTVTLALDEQGHFLALKADNLSNLGARAVSLSPLGKGAALVTGSYHIPVAALRARAAFTNTPPTQAYRSSGRPEVNFVLERLIERAARALNIDPVTLRQRNLVNATQMPYCNAMGASYDSGDYGRALEQARTLSDWDGFANRKRDSEARGRWRGRGLAHYVESSIGTPTERTDLSVGPNGQITVVIGTQPTGQGQETSFAQVAADLMGVDFEDVTVITGDTKIVSAGGGSHSGRSMRHAATVISYAVTDLIALATRRIASVQSIDEDHVHFSDGLFQLDGRNLALSWRDVAQLEVADNEDDDNDNHNDRGALWVRRDNNMPTPVFPNGCAVCEVEVDPETGHIDLVRYAAVDDVGRAINPMILHGQAHGSIAQGVGQALGEQVALDAASGQTLTGSLLDYTIPRADTVPTMDVSLMEVLSPTNPLGIKSGGEGATTPALAVVVNAVVDALAPLGVEHIEMPLTPLRIYETIRDARAKHLSEKA